MQNLTRALEKNAKRMGVSIDAHVTDLILEHIEAQRVARTKSFAELAKPFQKALAGLSDAQLDRLARPTMMPI